MRFQMQCHELAVLYAGPKDMVSLLYRFLYATLAT